jgi:hypothetical protein
MDRPATEQVIAASTGLSDAAAGSKMVSPKAVETSTPTKAIRFR